MPVSFNLFPRDKKILEKYQTKTGYKITRSDLIRLGLYLLEEEIEDKNNLIKADYYKIEKIKERVKDDKK